MRNIALPSIRPVRKRGPSVSRLLAPYHFLLHAHSPNGKLRIVDGVFGSLASVNPAPGLQAALGAARGVLEKIAGESANAQTPPSYGGTAWCNSKATQPILFR